jgi:hypothetical protein
LVGRAGERAGIHFLEFFTTNIRNLHQVREVNRGFEQGAAGC